MQLTAKIKAILSFQSC